MSTDSFYTSAGNFTSALNSSVDPRTGLFNVNLPLIKLHANCQLGPALSLNLQYSALSTVNVGFGKGFGLNLSHFNRDNRKLQFSTGEEYRVGGNDKVKQQKLKSFVFAKLDDSTYQVIHKSGTKERLSLHSGGIYVSTEISSADGRSLSLIWDSQFSPARLTQVTDSDGHILCSVAYPNGESLTTRFTLLPNVAELSHTITFKFRNELLIGVSDDAIDPALVWEFKYDDIGPQKLHHAIIEIKASTGLVEKISYDSEGMAFPTIAEQPALPRVHRHIVIPGCGQPKVTTTWKYTQKNYLGKDATFNLWQPDTDHMLNMLIHDYHYGSTEEHTDDSGNVLSAVTRRYNSYHLLVSEMTARDGKTHTQETVYYAQAGVVFDKQPAQFALPKKQTETWLDQRDATKSHSVVTNLEFDEDGNPIRQQAPDGTVTELTYYPAAGEGDLCPADPHGFVRYQRMETITPPQTCGNEAVSQTKFVWQKLDALHGSGYAVVQKSKDLYKGNGHSSTNHVYHTERSVPTIYGRIHSQQTIFTPDTSKAETKFINTRNFTYLIDSDANAITQRDEFIGHDGLTTAESQVRNMWTGQVNAEHSSTGVEIRYYYDKLGRVVRRSVCPDSIYENNSTWKYLIAEDGLYSTENDHHGNVKKTRFDFAGRSLSQHRFDTETNAWYELSSVAHNSLGEIVNSTVSDWQTGSASDSNNRRFPLTSDVTYDGWGDKKTVNFSNDKAQHQHFDYIQRTQTTYEEGGIDAHRLTTASETKSFDKLSGHLIRKTLTNGLAEEAYSSCQYTWDGVGQLIEEQDELGETTKRTYDDFGRVITQTLPDGTVLSRTYAPHSTGKFVTSISVTGRDANGTNQNWLLGTQTFDSLGRVTESTSGGRTTLYTYQGALAKPTVTTLPSGKTLTYTYIPELGNVISSMQTDGITQTFTYDKISGQLLTARESNAEIQYTYANDGRLLKETFLNDGSTKVAQHVQTLNGAPVTYIDVNGKRTQHIMDPHGLLTRIDDDNLTVDFTYDALARLSTKTVCDKSSGSVLTTKLEYDEFGHENRRTVSDQNGMELVVSETHKLNGLLATRTTEKNDVVIRSEQFDYDNRNRLTNYKTSGDNLPTDSYGNRMIGQNYQFDALNNLTCVTTYFPDSATNKATYHYDNADDPTQLTSVINVHEGSIQGYPANIQLKYDSEGRMVLDESGRTIAYDTLGRLRSVTDGNGRTSTYGYDTRNRIIQQGTGKNDDRQLYYRGAELVSEMSARPQCESRFIKSGHSCLGVWNGSQLRLTATDHNDSLLWSNHNGSGQFHAWTPYGSGGDANGDVQMLGFNGERIDPANGMYNLGNGYRTYNPILMRFNCPDSFSPFGAGGINSYAYCAGDPINHTDPSGHLSWQSIVGIVAGTVGLALAVFTGGASIAAAGGVMAALGAASTASLVIGTLGVVADVTAIASGALEKEDPEASAILGWISLGTGMVALAGGVRQLTKSIKSSKLEQRALFGTKVRLQNVEEFEHLTPAPIKVRAKDDFGSWHPVRDGKTRIWGSDVTVNHSSVKAFHEHLAAKIPKDRRILILTGVHGDAQGSNYVQRGTEILRKEPYKEFKFTSQDVNLIDHRTIVLDVHELDYIERIQWMCGDYEVILGYCYGRNDQALRYTFGLEPVTSFVRPTPPGFFKSWFSF